MDHVGLTSAVICGISAGGLVAQQLYGERRDLVSALILCATAARIGDAEAWNQRIATVQANGMAPVAQSLMAKWFTPGFVTANAAEVAGYRTMVERQPSAGYIATCAAIRDADLGDAARSIGVPTLCIAADHDGSVPAEAVEALARSIPAARLETIVGAGHLFCVEHAERTAAIIETFLRLLKPDSTAH